MARRIISSPPAPPAHFRRKSKHASACRSAGERFRCLFPSSLLGTLLWPHISLPLSLLVDSGTDDNSLKEGLAKQAQIPIEPLSGPMTILYLYGKPIAKVTHQTRSLILVISGNHREQICLFLIPSSAAWSWVLPGSRSSILSWTGRTAP